VRSAGDSWVPRACAGHVCCALCMYGTIVRRIVAPFSLAVCSLTLACLPACAVLRGCSLQAHAPLAPERMRMGAQFFEVDLPPVLERKVKLVDGVLPDTHNVRAWRSQLHPRHALCLCMPVASGTLHCMRLLTTHEMTQATPLLSMHSFSGRLALSGSSHACTARAGYHAQACPHHGSLPAIIAETSTHWLLTARLRPSCVSLCESERPLKPCGAHRSRAGAR